MKHNAMKICLATMATVVLILGSSCTTSANHEPIIASLEPEAQLVVPLGSVQVTCTATDPDGDELTYDWSASAGKVSAGQATINWTAPASEGSYNVTVVVTDGHGGEVTDRVAITVRVNNPPAIASLTADAEWTVPSGSVQVTCTASDPDGDELTYNWATTAGGISGAGAVVNWTAPQTVGEYDVTVVVRDGRGGSATKTLAVSVVTGQPPIIEGLHITAEHCYLKAFPWGYMVGKKQEYDIECIVSAGSGRVSYEWSCTGGAIDPHGSITGWIAPDASTFVTVTVMVSDIIGNAVAESVILEVVDCSPCTFGC